MHTNPRRLPRVLPVLVVALVVLVVISSAGWSDAARAGTHRAKDALDFSAPAVDGGTVQGGDYAKSGVALWFWAPW